MFGAVDGIISIKTHLRGNFDLSRFSDLAFLFIQEIWHDVQRGYGSILISNSSQTLAVSQSNNDLVYLWHNIWWNNCKAIFFLDGIFFVIDIFFISPKSACLLCSICGNVTVFFSFAPMYTVQKGLWNQQVYPKFINVIFENNLFSNPHLKHFQNVLYVWLLSQWPAARDFYFKFWFFWNLFLQSD